MTKKRKPALTPEQRERFSTTQRKLAERIAYRRAKLGEEPDPSLMVAATKSWGEMTREERAAERARSAETLRRLEERIAYHEARLAEERASQGGQAGTSSA